MKLSKATEIIESRLKDTGIIMTSISELRRIGHDQILPQLPPGKYVIARFGVAIPIPPEDCLINMAKD